MNTPAGYTTIAPWVVTQDTSALLRFVASVFGGEELAQVPLEDGSIGHAGIRVGDTVLLTLTDGRAGRTLPHCSECLSTTWMPRPEQRWPPVPSSSRRRSAKPGGRASAGYVTLSATSGG